MATLSARYVRRGRRAYSCDQCGRRIEGSHIYLYGMADREPPGVLRLHATGDCCPNLSGDPKIAAALRVAKEWNEQ